MAQLLKLKRSSVSGKVPSTSNLEAGELAINTADGKLFFERDDSTVQSIFTTNALTTGSLRQSGSDSYFLSNVGIKTTNPSRALEVRGMILVSGSYENLADPAYAGLFFDNPQSGHTGLIRQQDSNGGLILSSTECIIIKPNTPANHIGANVAIFCTSSIQLTKDVVITDSNLTVSGSVYVSGSVITGQVGSSTAPIGRGFFGGESDEGIIFVTGTTSSLTTDAGGLTYEGEPIAYATGSPGYLAVFEAERKVTGSVVFQNTGKIGIGTITPAAVLDVVGDLKVGTINAATTDTDTFLVSDSGIVKYRTGAQVLSDIGAQPAGNYVTDSGGAAGQLGVWSSATAMSGSNALYWTGTNLGVNTSTPSYKLEVKSGGANTFFTSFTPSGGSGFIRMYQDSNSHLSIYGANSAGTTNLVLNTSGVSYLKGGNVIIGGSADNGATLQVVGNISGSNNLRINGNITGSTLQIANINYPTTDGTLNQAIVTDGAGNLSFGSVAAATAANTVVTVKNVSGGTIEKGTPLYVTGSGTSGNVVGVWPADAGNPLRMPALLIAGEQLLDGAEGEGLLDGFIGGVNTSAFASGDEVFVAVGGGYTNVAPTGSGVLIQKLGNVEKVHASNGSGVINGPNAVRSLPNWETGKVMVGSPIYPVTSSFTYFDETNAVLQATGSFNSTLDSTFHTVSVGLGGGSVATNTRVGALALSSNTTGAHNTAVGYCALVSNTSGKSNTSVGYKALAGNTTGWKNVALGYCTLAYNGNGFGNVATGTCALRDNTGDYNVSVGHQSNMVNTTGDRNVALGANTLRVNTTGYRNVALGGWSLNQNTIGKCNVAVGTCALNQNTTGVCNVAVGTHALLSVQTGTNNVAMGTSALAGAVGYNFSNSTAVGHRALESNRASNNTAVGVCALKNNTTGAFNIALGVNALYANTTGTNNTAVGTNALVSNTTGISNTALGLCSLRYNTTGCNNTALGLQALRANTTGIYNVAIGSIALNSNTNGVGNVAIGAKAVLGTGGGLLVAVGYNSLRCNETSANTAIGAFSLFANTTGSRNTALGYRTLTCNTTGLGNTAVGYKALNQTVTGGCNTAVGSCALQYNTANNNTAVGFCTLRSNTAGTLNTATGHYALRANTTGNQNVAVGQCALPSNTVGSYNVAVGRNALRASTTGINNTALGFEALSSNTGGNFNTALGRRALCANTTGAVNTAVGTGALSGITTGQYNVGLGGYAASSFSTSSCNIFISDGQGNLRMYVNSTGNVGINTTNPTATLTVEGDLTISGIVTAQEFHTEFVSASIVYQSGSTKFGDTADDNHNFTGSINVDGDITLNNNNYISFLNSAGAKRDVLTLNSANKVVIDNPTGGYTSINGLMYVDVNSSVGIGTTSPTQLLEVAGAAQVDKLYFVSSSNFITVDQDTATNMSFTLNELQVARLHRVGSSGASLKLEQYSTGLTADGYPAYTFLDDDNTGMFLYNSDILGFSTSGSVKMVIDASGNVGIGTSSPGNKLHVSGSARFNGTIYSGDGGISTSNSLQLAYSAVSGIGTVAAKSTGGSTTLALQTANSGTTADRLYIASNGTIKLNAYGSGTKTGTPTYGLSVDSSGNIIETTANIDGSGAATQVTYWVDSNTITGSGDFTWDGTTLSINGILEANEKSFVIDHPLYDDKKLVYGVLEGPEHAVYCRGKISGEVIQLPEEWTGLVDEDSITVQLTSIGKHQNLYVVDIRDNKVFIKNGDLLTSKINAFYYVQGTRKDIKPLETIRQK